ncbi:hypothetical protein AgCh_027861 [Apium graveolens]
MAPKKQKKSAKEGSENKTENASEPESTFKVGPHCEDIVLKDKKKLNKPPKRYAFVSKSTWNNFVKQRTDPSWTGIYEVQSERVLQGKYHHRLSRKGYIGLKEEEPEEEPDRAIFWQKAQKRKNSEEVEQVDEDLAAVCEKINALLEKKEKGEIEFSGGEDVLTTALDSCEHSGWVRAVGGYVSPKEYFKLPREKKIRITKKELLARDRERDEKVDKKTQALEAEIAELKATMASGIALHDDDDDVDECVPTPTPPGVLGHRSCELSVNMIDNTVAFGMVYPGKDKEKVHGINIPLRHKCVSVAGLLKPDALLPVQVCGEMVTVRDALGSFLAWPEGLISYTTPAIKKKERKRPGTKPGLDLNNLKSNFLEAKPSAKVPKGFNLLYKHAVTWMKTTGVSIQIKCEKEVFGHEKVIYLLHENVQAVLEFEMLGQAVIASYMMSFGRYLHSEMSERPELVETFAFIDLGSTSYLNAEFETYIVNRLKEGNADRLFFLPHNQKGILSNLVAECAYVVMRYMKEIINDTRLTFTTKWLQKTRMCYTEEQLDEVRVEALGYIQEHI